MPKRILGMFVVGLALFSLNSCSFERKGQETPAAATGTPVPAPPEVPPPAPAPSPEGSVP